MNSTKSWPVASAVTGFRIFAKSLTSPYSAASGWTRQTATPTGHTSSSCARTQITQLADAHTRGWLTVAEFRIMSEFLQTLSAHSAPTGDDHDNAAVLDDPAWHAVVAAAQLARQELISAVTDDIAR